MTDQLTFPVRRRGFKFLGRAFIIMGAFTLLTSLFESDPEGKMLIAGIVGVVFGPLFLRALRNVDRIVVTEEAIRFLPVDVELKFSDIESLNLPSWATRHDNPPRSLTEFNVTTKPLPPRIVLGAMIQGTDRCRLYVVGCDSDALLDALRERVPKIEVGV
ncbi:MAG: hypothetical protein OIF48_03750 [Silicimonas sp.]|nr:hypothetical protein [Silicimonas sp.]